MKPIISYDSGVKILRIKLKKGKTSDSDIKKNIVFDYDKKGNILNIDVMNFDLELIAKKQNSKHLK